MITRETLKAQANLANLTDEQLATIETLSKNDENAVIGAKFGEHYRQLDATIAKSGIERNGDEKSYLYLDRVINEMNERVKTANSNVEKLTSEKAKLEKAIAEGNGDTETKKALEQAKKDLAAMTKQYTELQTKFDNANAEHEQKMFGFRVETELRSAAASAKFKKDIPEAVTRIVLNDAINKVKSMHPEYIKDEGGVEKLVFKNENGETLLNRENKMNAYTATELIANELKTMGVLDEGRTINGGGTKEPTPNAGKTSIIDLSAAKTRVEANDIAANALMAQGLIKGSKAYDDAMTQAWADYKISELPEK